MKIAKQIPAYLLGILFFGLGGIVYFFHLMQAPPPKGDALIFMSLFESSGYMAAIKVCELVGGLLLFFPRTRGIGLCIIAPIAINIFFFEIFLSKDIGFSILILVLLALAIFFEKEKFAGLLGRVSKG